MIWIADVSKLELSLLVVFLLSVIHSAGLLNVGITLPILKVAKQNILRVWASDSHCGSRVKNWFLISRSIMAQGSSLTQVMCKKSSLQTESWWFSSGCDDFFHYTHWAAEYSFSIKKIALYKNSKKNGKEKNDIGAMKSYSDVVSNTLQYLAKDVFAQFFIKYFFVLHYLPWICF